MASTSSLWEWTYVHQVLDQVSSNVAFKGLGAGRPAIHPRIDGVRELSHQDIATLEHGRAPAAKGLRDSHHRLARMIALGLRNEELLEASGYSNGRISVLKADPAFQDLIAHYRMMVNEGFTEAADEYYRTVSANRTISARRINDKLADDDEDIPLRTLLAIHSDAADRTGYPKRSVAVNVSVDFAAKLEKAVQRSKTVRQIEEKALEPSDGVPTKIERRL